MTADVSNQLPMNLIVSVTPVRLDANGKLEAMRADEFAVKVWTGDDESLGQNLIFAGTTANPRVTKLHIQLKQNNDDALSQIEGIIYRANGVTPQDNLSESIKESSHLKLENIELFLKGKVVKDLDD
jgi:hypothetical protein